MKREIERYRSEINFCEGMIWIREYNLKKYKNNKNYNEEKWNKLNEVYQKEIGDFKKLIKTYKDMIKKLEE